MTSEEADGGGVEPVALGAPSRLALTLVVVPLLAMVAAQYVGDALAPTLVDTQPALLILLSSKIRYLVLTVNQLDPVAFYGIGLFRNLAPDPFFYLLGYWYGAAAVRWMERRTRTLGELLALLERAFARWGAPLVFLFPNNPICLLAGAARMSPLLFVAVNVAGTVARLVAIAILGATFEVPIDWVLDLIRTYRIPLLVVSVAAVLFTTWNETRKGTSEIDQLRNLERELGRVDDAPDTGTSSGDPDR